MTRLRIGQLARRERQIMDIIFRLGEASAEEVRSRLPNPPGNATVRRQLSILEEKGILQHRQEGQVFIYRPTVPHEEASRSAIQHMIDTFFEGSMHKAVAAMLSISGNELTKEEIEELWKRTTEFEQQEECHE